MSKNSFVIIMDWPYHPQMILALSGMFIVAAGWDGGSFIELLFTALLLSPLIGFVMFLPYLFIVSALAACLSLYQAIRKALGRPAPKAH